MADSDRRKILVLGGKKSGKTSCIRTVFGNLPPKETVWLEMTTKVTKMSFDSIIPLDIYDTPANFDPLEEVPTLPCSSNPPVLELSESTSQLPKNGQASGSKQAETGVVLPSWSEISAVVYVVDLQAGIDEVSRKVADVLIVAHAYNPNISFHVFAHKADGLSGEYQEEYFRTLSQCVSDEVYDANVSDYFPPSISTATAGSPTTRGSPSRHAHSNSQTHAHADVPPPDLSGILDDEQQFLEEVIAQHRVWITSVQDSSVFEAWSRVIQKLMEGVYGEMEKLLNTFLQTSGLDNCYLFDINAKIYVSMDASGQGSNAFQLCSDFLGRSLAFRALYAHVPDARRGMSARKAEAETDPADGPDGRGEDGSEEEDYPEEKEWPTEVIRLGSSTTLACWQFNSMLALICLVRSEIYDEQEGMIEYNATMLRWGLLRMVDAMGPRV